MLYRLPKSTVGAIEAALGEYLESDRKPDYKEFSIVFGASYQTICYYYRKLKFMALIREDHRKKPSRKRLITPEIELAVAELLASKPSTYQDEIADFLYEEFDVKLSQPRISELIKRINYSHKKMKVIAAQQNEDLRSNWQANKLPQWTAE